LSGICIFEKEDHIQFRNGKGGLTGIERLGVPHTPHRTSHVKIDNRWDRIGGFLLLGGGRLFKREEKKGRLQRNGLCSQSGTILGGKNIDKIWTRFVGGKKKNSYNTN